MRTYDFLDYKDFTTLYQDVMFDLINVPEHMIAPRGMKIREFVNVTVTVNPTQCTIDFSNTGAPERQEAYDRYRKAELEWYLSGNTLASSAPSKFWNQLANKDGHITSNYGHMMLIDKIYPSTQPSEYDTSAKEDGSFDGKATQYYGEMQTAVDRAVDTLLKDPDSRQAIVHYNQPKHCWPDNKDFPCTVYSQFFLRDGCLSITTYQRSCDIIKGFSYDVPWSCHFLEMVVKKLSDSGMDVALGEFTHVFGSLHLYEKDLELAQRIVEKK